VRRDHRAGLYDTERRTGIGLHRVDLAPFFGAMKIEGVADPDEIDREAVGLILVGECQCAVPDPIEQGMDGGFVGDGEDAFHGVSSIFFDMIPQK